MTGGCSRDNFSECRVPSCGDGGTSGRFSLGPVHLRLLVRSVVAIISFLPFAFLFLSCPRSSDGDGDGGTSSRFFSRAVVLDFTCSKSPIFPFSHGF